MAFKLTGEGDEDEVPNKRALQFSDINSLDMKTKVVQHVLRINLSHFKI